MPFSPETIAFLIENRMRNDRTWYHENKPTYQRVVFQPMCELVERLEPTVLKIDPMLVTVPKIDATISRIYRDARRVRPGESFYRENVWCVFRRDKRLYHGVPALYFEFSPEEWSFGCGYYEAGSETMLAARELILQRDKTFLAAKRALAKAEGFVLEGDRFRRTRHPDEPEEMRDWLDRKTFSAVYTSRDFDLLYSDELWRTIADGYEAIAPVYAFFQKAEARKNGLA